MTAEARRPVLRWHGGKWRIAPWIISHFPPHRVYVEAYGGAASVLIRKARSYCEIYNDLDDEVVEMFEVIRSPEAGRLIQAVRDTPLRAPGVRAVLRGCNRPRRARTSPDRTVVHGVREQRPRGLPDWVPRDIPPYLHETRTETGAYRHEMSERDHEELLAVVQRLRGMVVISGYRSSLYDDALAGWSRRRLRAHADGARSRVEHL